MAIILTGLFFLAPGIIFFFSIPGIIFVKIRKILFYTRRSKLKKAIINIFCGAITLILSIPQIYLISNWIVPLINTMVNIWEA